MKRNTWTVTVKDNLKEPESLLYLKMENGKDEFIGAIKSSIQLYDVRLQIKEKQLEGYRVWFSGEWIEIDKDGQIENWPKGFYTQITEQLNKLFDI